MMPFSDDEDFIPVLQKLDATRDLVGAFFAPGNWREKHKELQHALTDQFETDLKDNGNSFNSCFQFEGRASEGYLYIRIKYYWKNLALL